MLRFFAGRLMSRIVPAAMGAVGLATASGAAVWLAHLPLAWHLEHPQYAAGVLLLAATSACSLLLMLSRDSTEAERRRLADENQRLEHGRDEFLERSLRFERRIESLAMIREIHRTGNINDRDERLRRLLWILGDLSSAQDVTLFYRLADGRASPAAYLRLTDKHELFLCFDRPAAGEEPPAGALGCSEVAATHRNGRLNLTGSLLAGGLPAGSAELSVEMTPGELAPPTDFQGVMERHLARKELEPGAVTEALEHKTVLRSRDASEGTLELAVPLVAETELVGALRVRLRLDRIAHVRLADVEEVLLEAGKHIAMALKKEEDSFKAATDALTGLLVKRVFVSRLEEEFGRARADGTPFSLVMMDIDHFKKVNDKHGHPSGDAILRGVARVLRQNLRAGDVAFRYGGEELVAILPGATKVEAKKTAERLRRAVETSEFLGDKGQVVPVTVSLGVADYEASTAAPADVLDRADQALYRAKHGGRNCVRAWPLKGRSPSKRSGRISERRVAADGPGSELRTA